MEWDFLLEEALTAEERKKIKTKSFGIPELKKYPLIDAAHVKSAISYFHKCPPQYKKELARNIIKAAKKFGVKIGDNAEVMKYTETADITTNLNELKDRVFSLAENQKKSDKLIGYDKKSEASSSKEEKNTDDEEIETPPENLNDIIDGLSECERWYDELTYSESTGILLSLLNGEDDEDDYIDEGALYLHEMVNKVSGKNINLADQQDDDSKNFQVQSHNTYDKLKSVHHNDYGDDASEDNYFIDLIKSRFVYSADDLEVDNNTGKDPNIQDKIDFITNDGQKNDNDHIHN